MAAPEPQPPRITTVTLNPAVDRVIEAEGLTLGQHAQVQTLRRIAGGKGVNVSGVLAGLGIDHAATGFLGQDNHSLFATALARMSVRDEFYLLDGATRENITLTDPTTGRDTHLRDRGLAVTPRDLGEFQAQLIARIEPGDQVLFCGSLPPGVSPDALAELTAACIDAEATVIVDISGPAATALRHQKLTLIKPNLDELADWCGKALPGRDEQLKAARGLAQRFGMILLSAGAEGAYLVLRESTIHALVVDPPEPVNTVGCGDVLLGRFVGQLNLGLADDEALADAVATATASAVCNETARWDDELARACLEQIEVTEI